MILKSIIPGNQTHSLLRKKIHSHVVFTLKNSRYDIERIHRKKPAGYIAPTYPFIDGQEEEFLIEILCNVLDEIGLELYCLNFCGDHVHAIIGSDKEDISRIMMIWKGKTAYLFNRIVNPEIDTLSQYKSDGTKQTLWAKSYYQKMLKTKEQLDNAVKYVLNNRKKHDLPALSDKSIERINTLILKTKRA